MKRPVKQTIAFVGLFIHGICSGGCSDPKITNKVLDESGDPIQDAETWVSWEVNKTLNPWDGTKDVNESAKTNDKGEYTFSKFKDSKLWVGARSAGHYESHRYYTFTEADERLEHPWHPTVTLILRKKQNPISMYAKNFFEWNLPASEFGYDLIKGDFVPPHGNGEITDCIFKFELESEGKLWAPDYKRCEYFSLTFIGDFNGFAPIENTALSLDSIFVWPREAYDTSYSLQTISTEQNYSEIPDPNNPKRRLRIDPFVRIPDNTHFFFRIRSEKNPDGTFKSALYGKMILGRVEIFTIPSSGKTEYRLKQFSYYVNPTRNDRNMEYDAEHDNNLSYPRKKSWQGEGYWKTSGYKNGERRVTAP